MRCLIIPYDPFKLNRDYTCQKEVVVASMNLTRSSTSFNHIAFQCSGTQRSEKNNGFQLKNERRSKIGWKDDRTQRCVNWVTLLLISVAWLNSMGGYFCVCMCACVWFVKGKDINMNG